MAVSLDVDDETATLIRTFSDSTVSPTFTTVTSSSSCENADGTIINKNSHQSLPPPPTSQWHCVGEADLHYTTLLLHTGHSLVLAVDDAGRTRYYHHLSRRRALLRVLLLPLLLLLPQAHTLVDLHALGVPALKDVADRHRHVLLRLLVGLDLLAWSTLAVLAAGGGDGGGWGVPRAIFVRPLEEAWGAGAYGALVAGYVGTAVCGWYASWAGDRKALAVFVCATSMASIATCVVLPSPLVFTRFVPAYLAWLML